jgi:hypothetical protein
VPVFAPGLRAAQPTALHWAIVGEARLIGSVR